MKTRRDVMILIGCAILCFLLYGLAGGTPDLNAADHENKSLPTVAAAREQAKLLHTMVHQTLQVVHHELFREDEGLRLPAAVLKDVFGELEKEHSVTLKWLAVQGRAMNTDHEPKNEFEQKAAKQLAAGEEFVEQTDGGLYRRAGAITLINVCLKCHVPDRKSLENRVSGLMITIPVR
jgi:hypothetical protein